MNIYKKKATTLGTYDANNCNVICFHLIKHLCRKLIFNGIAAKSRCCLPDILCIWDMRIGRMRN